LSYQFNKRQSISIKYIKQWIDRTDAIDLFVSHVFLVCNTSVLNFMAVLKNRSKALLIIITALSVLHLLNTYILYPVDPFLKQNTPYTFRHGHTQSYPSTQAATIYLPSDSTSSMNNTHGDPHSKARIEYIPKIIHQSWKTKKLPKRFQVWSDSWKRNHPGWEYNLWTDQENQTLVEVHFPWFLVHYNKLKTMIQKADTVRYMYLYKYGGLIE